MLKFIYNFWKTYNDELDVTNVTEVLMTRYSFLRMIMRVCSSMMTSLSVETM